MGGVLHMRTFLGALVLYVVIAFPFGFQTGIATAPVWALAKPAPVSDPKPATETKIEPAPSASPVSLTAEKIMAMLLELARPEPKPTKAEMCRTLADAATTHNLPVGFFVRLIQQESDFDPDTVSSAGAQGVAQFMPAVAKEWNLSDPFDPHAALRASARFLSALREQFGNWGLAAAAYNGGSGRVQKWLDKRGKLPKETQDYVKIITGIPAENWKGATHKVSFSIPAKAPCQEIAYLADPPEPVVIIPKDKKEPAHAKSGKEKAKLAEKSSGKSAAKTKSEKKPVAKGRVQIADARSSRK